MKILAFNGSPRMKSGHTERILGPLLEGAIEAGAEVESIYLRKLNLHPCIGCFSCWFKTPGICSINDDIHMLKHKLMESEVVIFATPIYMYSCSGYMKILMERLLFSIAMPDFILVDDISYHPARFPNKVWKGILIANGAFDGDDVFKPTIDMYERAFDSVIDSTGKKTTFSLGSIAVGYGELFMDGYVKSKCEPLFECMRKAGQELVQQGYITAETLEAANKPLYYHAGLTRQQAVDRANKRIAESKTTYTLTDYR